MISWLFRSCGTPTSPLRTSPGHNLELVAQLCRKDIRANELPATVSTTTDRRAALEDADYVVNCTRIGGLEAFALDVEIPLKYGIDQCVGDTICAGGIMYAQRNIPQVLAFCRDAAEAAKPGALFINYSNPMAMNTWAALDHGFNVVGLCHGVQNTTRQIADVLGAERPEDLYVSAAGINHQTWFVELLHKGAPVTGQELLEAYEGHPAYSRTEKVRIDVLRRFGYYSTESNGHLSEYLPWYRKRREEIADWIDLSRWSHGETGGYLRVCKEWRSWFDTDFAAWLEAEDPPISSETRTSEHASYIIEAMETGRTYRGHFNVRNDGAITNLPDDCVVEVPGVRRRGRHQDTQCWGAAAGLRGHLQRLHQRPAHGQGGGPSRRRDAPQAGDAPRPSHGGGVQPRRGVADDRRDAGGPGPMAAPVRRRDTRGQEEAGEGGAPGKPGTARAPPACTPGPWRSSGQPA